MIPVFRVHNLHLHANNWLPPPTPTLVSSTHIHTHPGTNYLAHTLIHTYSHHTSHTHTHPMRSHRVLHRLLLCTYTHYSNTFWPTRITVNFINHTILSPPSSPLAPIPTHNHLTYPYHIQTLTTPTHPYLHPHHFSSCRRCISASHTLHICFTYLLTSVQHSPPPRCRILASSHPNRPSIHSPSPARCTPYTFTYWHLTRYGQEPLFCQHHLKCYECGPTHTHRSPTSPVTHIHTQRKQ